jgi:hypothetical protein
MQCENVGILIARNRSVCDVTSGSDALVELRSRFDFHDARHSSDNKCHWHFSFCRKTLIESRELDKINLLLAYILTGVSRCPHSKNFFLTHSNVQMARAKSSLQSS